MSSHAPEKELDPTPLVNAILEKTKAGKLKWQETANEYVFIASVGGNTTLKVRYNPEGPDILSLLNENGKLIWEITDPMLPIDELFTSARRIALRVDERVEALMETL